MVETTNNKDLSYAKIIETVFALANIEFGHEATALWTDTRISDLGDSLDITLFVMKIEKTFSVEITDAQIEALNTKKMEDLILLLVSILKPGVESEQVKTYIDASKKQHIKNLQSELNRLEKNISTHRQEVNKHFGEVVKLTDQINTLKANMRTVSKTVNTK